MRLPVRASTSIAPTMPTTPWDDRVRLTGTRQTNRPFVSTNAGSSPPIRWLIRSPTYPLTFWRAVKAVILIIGSPGRAMTYSSALSTSGCSTANVSTFYLLAPQTYNLSHGNSVSQPDLTGCGRRRHCVSEASDRNLSGLHPLDWGRFSHHLREFAPGVPLFHQVHRVGGHKL
jgi:hypothetical protein